MIRKLVLTSTFKKAFQKFVKHNPNLQEHIENTLLQMQKDAFTQHLSTHKLSGKLLGLYASSCGYDCRIIFTLEKISDSEIIILLNIGTHDSVY